MQFNLNTSYNKYFAPEYDGAAYPLEALVFT
jgi:hypothetical protein